MNCKQGDLAIVIRSQAGANVGRIITCVKFVGTVDGKTPRGTLFTIFQKDLWLTDQDLLYTNGMLLPYASDANLMPIGNINPLLELTKELEHENA